MVLPAPPPTAQRRPRPRRLWFFVGGGLVLLAVTSFVLLMVLVLSRSTHTDDVATLSPAGTPASLEVEAGEKRMLFSAQGQPALRCTMTDANGTPVALDPARGNTTVGTGGTSWTGVATFTARTDQVELQCDDPAPGQQVRVGAPLGAGFVGGLLAVILVPLVLGGAGMATIVVTTILWFTRSPRTA